jgi:hypothetical protein
LSPLSPTVAAYLYGILTAASLIAALFFLRFWRRSRDGLFCCFALAFVLMAGNNALSAFVGGDQYPAIYLLRLAAFGLIIFGILRKNL